MVCSLITFMTNASAAAVKSMAISDALRSARMRLAEEARAIEITAQWPGSLDHRFAVAEHADLVSLIARLEAKS